MDYEIGSATDAHDMLEKIRLFLAANGWTQNGFATETYGHRLHLSRGAVFVNLFSAIESDPITTNAWTSTTYRMSGIALSPSTGYSASPTGAKAWKNMPGALSRGSTGMFTYADNIFACAVADMTGAVASYHMAADGDNFICAMEIATGDFRWVAFGTLAPYGAIGAAPNGFYLCASLGVGGNGLGPADMRRIFAHNQINSYYPNCTVRFADSWAYSGGSPVGLVLHPISPLGQGYAIYSESSPYWGYMHGLLSSMPADIGGLSPLFPAQIGVEYSGYRLPIGHFDLARVTHMGGFSVGQQITVGGEDFVVLPCNRADAAYPYGIAIRVTGA